MAEGGIPLDDLGGADVFHDASDDVDDEVESSFINPTPDTVEDPYNYDGPPVTNPWVRTVDGASGHITDIG